MIRVKNLKKFCLILISLSFMFVGCDRYSVYWNDFRDEASNDCFSISFVNENTGKIKDVDFKCNKTKNIIISKDFYAEGFRHPSNFNFHYFIDYETKKIEIYLVDVFLEKITDDKVMLKSKDFVFGYQLVYADLENEKMVTVISKDSLIEIPSEESRINSNELLLKEMLNKMNYEDICYYADIDKDHLSLYPPVSILYLVKGKVLNEFYWISSSRSDSIDFYINEEILPSWLK